jgi:hypothetical protein
MIHDKYHMKKEGNVNILNDMLKKHIIWYLNMDIQRPKGIVRCSFLLGDYMSPS